MKKLLLSSAILATFALFTACGDDSSSGPEEESSSSIEAEDKSSSSVEEEGKSSAADKKSSSSEAKKRDSSSSGEATCSSEEDSSSSEESSSSEAVAEVMPSGTYDCDTYNCVSTTYLKAGITYGEILDTRDDQVYKVVSIGDQVWMAQNLNYAYNVRTSSLDSTSFCYYGEADSCAKYGRLYLWSAAMDSASIFSNTGKGCGYYGSTCSASEPVQGVCPSGWHLPSLAEWKRLLEPMATSMDDYSSYWYYYGAGRMLKSEEGWDYYSESTEGIDYYGFSALPAGYRNSYGSFFSAGSYAYFWSSSEYDSNFAYYVTLDYSTEFASLDYYDKYYAYSVRCIKDN